MSGLNEQETAVEAVQREAAAQAPVVSAGAVVAPVDDGT
jgi:hypothetical protein